MYYYLYQITNRTNNRFYIGVHKTRNLNDCYMGSGKLIKQAIKKNGVSNFEKVILEFFGTSNAMYAREAEIVNDDFLENNDVYNIIRGGSGEFNMDTSLKGSVAAATPDVCKRRHDTMLLKNHGKGINNSQYGKRFVCITDENINKRIDANDIIPDGWRRGLKKLGPRSQPR